MRRTIGHLATLLAGTLVCGACGRHATLVGGRVGSADGTRLTVAHVSAPPDGPGAAAPVASVETDGRFTLRTGATGIVPLVFSGLTHEPLRLPLFVERPGAAVELDVRLGPLRFADSFDQVAVIGDFNGFRSGRTAVPMVRRPDGTFRAHLTGLAGATLAYQLLGVAAPVEGINSTHPGPPVAGTDSARVELRPDGRYASVVEVKQGAADVVFDPARLARGTGDPVWDVRQGPPATVAFAAFEHEMEQALGDYTRRRIDLSERGASQAEVASFVAGYDWSRFHAPLRAVLAGDASPLFKQAATMLYVGTLGEVSEMTHCELDPAILRRVLQEIPPDSPLWAAVPDAFPAVTWADHLRPLEGYRDYFDRLVAGHPDLGLRAQVLAYDLSVAYYAEQRERAQRDYDRLVAAFPDSPEAATARRLLAPDKKVAEGKPVPAFRVASLDDPGTVYTNAGLLGHVVLIDFWGTWCGPCLGEMPYLHQAFEKYHGRGLEILSLSCDDSEATVRRFRKGRWPMPWMHGFLAGCYGARTDNELVRAFEVVGFPSTFLVDRDGTIVATGPALRGANLDATLARVFAPGGGHAAR